MLVVPIAKGLLALAPALLALVPVLLPLFFSVAFYFFHLHNALHYSFYIEKGLR